MHRIDSAGNNNGQFVEEDLSTNTAGTVVSAAWLNSQQEEIAKVIEEQGILLNPSTNDSYDQLNTAIDYKIRNSGNYTIDPTFDIWLEASSINNNTSNDFYGSVLMGGNCGSGGSPSMTLSQQNFVLGQTDVPNNPRHFLQAEQLSVATSTASYVYYKIERVDTNANNKITVSFYVQGGANYTIEIDYLQHFGTGGTPSSNITIASQTAAVTTGWTKITKTFQLPSISSKILGTDNNDYLMLRIKLPINDTNLIQIANLKQQAGVVATDLAVVNIANELRKSQRYYQKIIHSTRDWPVFITYSPNGDTRGRYYLLTQMRTTPNVTFVGNSSFTFNSIYFGSSAAQINQNSTGYASHITPTGFGLTLTEYSNFQSVGSVMAWGSGSVPASVEADARL